MCVSGQGYGDIQEEKPALFKIKMKQLEDVCDMSVQRTQ